MFVLTIFWAGVQAYAQLQMPPTTVPFKPKPILETEIPCERLADHIRSWGLFRADADVAVASYGEQLNNAVDNWVKTLKPLEGKTTAVEVGFFKPVEDGSKSLQENIPMIYENSSYFDSHLNDVILPALEKCLSEKK